VQEKIFENWNLATIKSEPGDGDDGLLNV